MSQSCFPTLYVYFFFEYFWHSLFQIAGQNPLSENISRTKFSITVVWVHNVHGQKKNPHTMTLFLLSHDCGAPGQKGGIRTFSPTVVFSLTAVFSGGTTAKRQEMV
jgi:hypothetical protein